MVLFVSLCAGRPNEGWVGQWRSSISLKANITAWQVSDLIFNLKVLGKQIEDDQAEGL